MKKRFAMVIMLLVACSLTGCISLQPDQERSALERKLGKIALPSMSESILEGNEEEWKEWLASLYQFELDTLRAQSSELTEDDLLLVKNHLAQIYGPKERELLLSGFYQYDELKETYYVPNGSWFTYNENWPSSKVTLLDHEPSSALLRLTGIDDYGDNKRHIVFRFSVDDRHLRLEERIYPDSP